MMTTNEEPETTLKGHETMYQRKPYRIMMKAAPGYSAECWAECVKESEIAPQIVKMRDAFGANEPARVMKVMPDGTEKILYVDDPQGVFGPGEAQAEADDKRPPFCQIDYGAVMPPQALTHEGTCSQCGRTGQITQAHIVGMGQVVDVEPCAECLTDMASGTQVVSATVTVPGKDGKPKTLAFDSPNAVLRD